MPVPMGFRAIAVDLQERIEKGEYEPGARLPSYPELATLYSVSVSTAQRAVGLLIERRWVVSSPGRGLFVPDELPTN
nr:winged helix-turn-helix domain-containing protein [Micromonospora sp. DSM 115978]